MIESKIINFKEVDPTELEQVFVKYNVFFTREFRMNILKKIIEPKYIAEKEKLEKEKDSSEKSMNIKDSIRLHRLGYYKALSEFQLENDYIYYDDKLMIEDYLNLFWSEMENYISTLDTADKIFDEINNLEKKDVVIKSVCDYNRYFSSRVIEQNNYFDGVPLHSVVKLLNETSTEKEILRLSDKYRIFIPKYWTKNDLQMRLKKHLQAKHELTPELIRTIDSCSVKNLKTMLNDNNVDSKLHLTKKDMIYIIMKKVDTNSVCSLPQDEDDLEITTPIVKPVVVEEPVIHKPVIEEPILDEVKEEVTEEPDTKKETTVLSSTKVVEDNNKECDKLLNVVISNQDTIIKQNEEPKVRKNEYNNVKYNRVFSIIILVVIVVLCITWLIYVINRMR